MTDEKVPRSVAENYSHTERIAFPENFHINQEKNSDIVSISFPKTFLAFII